MKSKPTDEKRKETPGTVIDLPPISGLVTDPPPKWEKDTIVFKEEEIVFPNGSKSTMRTVVEQER